MKLVKLKMPDGKASDVRKGARVELAQSDDPEVLQQLLKRYWGWHFDESLTDAARTLLGTDLGWEHTQNLTDPPIGAVVSPLGYALDHEDSGIRDAAFEVLDSMVEIPAGEVLVGEGVAPVWVDAFEMGRYPVTNAAYRRFIQQTGHDPPSPWVEGAYPEFMGDHPVTWVSCADAEAYATWSGCQLPAFEAWQRAVRGDGERLFPWGDEIDKPRCNTAELGVGGTTPVGTFPEGVSPFGCYDMLGNVWEWTSTWYDDADPQFRVVRGGAWYYNHEHSTCTSYDFFSTEYTEFVIGFRVVR